MTEYSDDDTIKIFKETKSKHEKAPHWTGQVILSDELLKEAKNSGDNTIRVALWKVHFKEKEGFFLAGKASMPFEASQVEDDDDDWGDDDF